LFVSPLQPINDSLLARPPRGDPVEREQLKRWLDLIEWEKSNPMLYEGKEAGSLVKRVHYACVLPASSIIHHPLLREMNMARLQLRLVVHAFAALEVSFAQAKEKPSESSLNVWRFFFRLNGCDKSAADRLFGRFYSLCDGDLLW